MLKIRTKQLLTKLVETTTEAIYNMYKLTKLIWKKFIYGAKMYHM